MKKIFLLLVLSLGFIFNSNAQSSYSWGQIGTFNNPTTFNNLTTINGVGNLLKLNASTNTREIYTYYQNLSGDLLEGVDGSAGGAVFLGALPYSASIGTGVNFPFHIATNNNVRATFLTNGYFGLGTTAPQWLFTGIKSSNGASSTSFPTGKMMNTLAVKGNGTTTFNVAEFKVSSGNDAVIGGIWASYDSILTGVQFGSALPTINTNIVVNDLPVMTFTNARRTGLYTKTPTSTFEVNGSSLFDSVLTSAQYIFMGSSAAGNKLYLNSTGADYGTIQLVNSTTWGFGYTTTIGTTGTPSLTWTNTGNVGVAGTLTTKAIIYTNNAIAAVSNAATVPITSLLSTVTNNSAATLTITITTTSATDGQLLYVRVYDFSGVAQTLTWVNTENGEAVAPVLSNGSTTSPKLVHFMYNSKNSLWRCIN